MAVALQQAQISSIELSGDQWVFVHGPQYIRVVEGGLEVNSQGLEHNGLVDTRNGRFQEALACFDAMCQSGTPLLIVCKSQICCNLIMSICQSTPHSVLCMSGPTSLTIDRAIRMSKRIEAICVLLVFQLVEEHVTTDAHCKASVTTRTSRLCAKRKRC